MRPERIPAASIRDTVVSRYERGTVPAEDGIEVGTYPHSIPLSEYERLVSLALAEATERTIEVGLCVGFSALAFLEASSVSRSPAHVAMDPFQLQIWRNAGLAAVRSAGLAGRFEFFEEESQLVLPRLVVEGREFDLGFVDGDHRFESAFLDLYYMTRLVRPGGLVIADDVQMPAVRLAIAYFQTNMGCEVLVPGNGTDRWVSIDERTFLRSPARLAGLRLPARRGRPLWDDFTPFGLEEVAGRPGLAAVIRAARRRARSVLGRSR